ncbi:MAG TPA: YvrJ family protein [Clostridium sp.]|jgi:hypothetical protein|nr:YvrJ family protein [Clostridiales bacterium]HBC96740.1 YvrJ family protein [Clostridium sp.]
MYDQLVNLIGTLGFPAAVSIYLLFSFGAKLDALIKSVQELERSISAVMKHLE